MQAKPFSGSGTMRAKKLRHRLFASAALLALAGTKPLIAATYVWTGGGDNPRSTDRSLSGTYLNWGNTTTLPGSGDDVVFGSGFASGMPLIDQAIFNSVTIDTTTPIELDGAALELASANITRTTTSSGTQSINLSSIDIFSTNSIWDLQGSGALSVSSAINDLNSSSHFSKTGSADLILTSGFSFSGRAAVAGGNLILNGGW